MIFLKAAIYARVSTGLQATEGTSLESQIDLCIKKAKELGIREIEIYKEEGFTGEDLDRPEMNRLRHDIQKNNFTHIICTHPDRLSRDMTDKLIVCREFEKNGIELVFVDTEYKNTPEGQLFFNMQSAIAQYELALIKKRTVRGRIRKVIKDKQIMPMRIPPYGYDWVNGQLIINEKEAEFVKLIYRWYVFDQLTMREIGERLYSLGAIPKKGESKNWSASTIGKILKSEIYIGKYYYNRRSTKKVKGEKTKGGNIKKIYTIRDKSEWIEVEVPAIIDKQLFELAQKQKLKNTKRLGRNNKHQYLLKSMIKCGNCGRTWQATTYNGKFNSDGSRKTYPMYRCPNKYPKKYGPEIERCKTPTIRTDILDNYIWNLIVDIIKNPDLFINRNENKTESSLSQLENMINLINNQIMEKEKEKEKIKLMFRKSIIDEEELETEIQTLNKEISKLNDEIKKYQEEIDLIKRNNVVTDMTKQLLIYMEPFLNDEQFMTFEKKKFIIDKLIDEIIITFDELNKEMQITCIGAIALNKDVIINNSTTTLPSFASTTSKSYERKTRLINDLNSITRSVCTIRVKEASQQIGQAKPIFKFLWFCNII